MRKELVRLQIWESEDGNYVHHEAQAYIRKGIFRFIQAKLYSRFAVPDCEFAGATKRCDWKNVRHLIDSEFENNNAILDHYREKNKVQFVVDLEVIEDPDRKRHSEPFDAWEKVGWLVEL